VKRRFAAFGATSLSLGLGVLAFGAGPVGALPAGSGGTLIPTPGHLLSLHGGTSDSLNWAGYAVTPGSGISAVDSTFTVPSAAIAPPGFSATWGGIGGYTSTDLIQAGVSEEDPITSTLGLLGPQYNAWYEILPAAETPITNCAGDTSCTVTPGDKMTVKIDNAGGNVWDISIDDAGRWSWSTSLTYASSESSAEWIQEAPSLGGAQTIPANVGNVAFGPTSTYTDGSGTHTIAAGNPTLIDESATGIVNLATTSPLAGDGESFNVCVYAESCAAP
jgi:hypothetical protein